MNLPGVLGAVVGGLIGAAIWGLGFGGPGGMEGGWVPIVVGALTGGGCALFRGRGMKMAERKPLPKMAAAKAVSPKSKERNRGFAPA